MVIGGFQFHNQSYFVIRDLDKKENYLKIANVSDKDVVFLDYNVNVNLEMFSLV